MALPHDAVRRRTDLRLPVCLHDCGLTGEHTGEQVANETPQTALPERNQREPCAEGTASSSGPCPEPDSAY